MLSSAPTSTFARLKMTDKIVSSPVPDMQQARGDFGPIDWVGMSGIATLLCIEGQQIQAIADIHVNLIDPQTRGIHMSRLFALIDQMTDTELSPQGISHTLEACVSSQAGISTQARLKLKFNWLGRSKALISDRSGWRAYPVAISALLEKEVVVIWLQVELIYSSTCPSSAALSRHVLQQRFLAKFPEHQLQQSDISAWLLTPEGGSAATAHAQRSLMQVNVALPSASEKLPIASLVSALENALQTPVQTAVKRIDEQAFAERNGANLMFVEDALRRAKTALIELGFRRASVSAQHLESLHAHDATGEVSW
jgi:GTP cyclohydrolase IB